MLFRSIAWAGGLSFLLAWFLKRLGGDLRVAHEDEEIGLDVAAHSEPSYPAYSGMDLH